MKPNKTLPKSAEPPLQGAQQAGKISHWKKIRLKRKQMKQQMQKNAVNSQAKNSNIKHKPGKNRGARMEKKKKVMTLIVQHSERRTKSDGANKVSESEVKDCVKAETVKPGKKHADLNGNRKRKMKKKSSKAKNSEKKNTTVVNQDPNNNTDDRGSKTEEGNEQPKNDPEDQVILPSNPTEFSSNWKKLQSSLKPKIKRTGSPPAKKRKLETSTTSTEEIKSEPAEEEIWFDDVDEILIEKKPHHQQNGKGAEDSLVMPNATTELTKALAMDCEMVGVGKDGEESILARVSLVNQHGHCVYDKFVRPREKVTDFRTRVSGVRPLDLRRAEDFLVVQKKVADMLKGRLLVGHALHNDLKVLFLDHPRRMIRDTAQYKPFRQLMGTNRPSLKKLTAKVLGVKVQEKEHSSVQDAQAAMRLYTMHRKRWEQELKMKRLKHKKPSS